MANKIDLKNVILKIQDNGSNEVEVKFDAGNFTYTEQITIEYDLDRGLLDATSLGDEVPMEINFQGRYDYFKGDSSEVTLRDALRNAGEAAGWESSSASIEGQECSPYSVDLELTNTPTCSTGISNPIETTVFGQFRAENIAFDTSAGTVNVTGKCNITAPTSVRSS